MDLVEVVYLIDVPRGPPAVCRKRALASADLSWQEVRAILAYGANEDHGLDVDWRHVHILNFRRGRDA